MDEGAPSSIAEVLKARGYRVIPHHEVLPQGASDPMVARHAIENGAVLIAMDRDMRRMASRFSKEGSRYGKLDLIQFACPEPMAASRLEQAITLLELEWGFRCEKAARRLYIEVGQHYLRTNR